MSKASIMSLDIFIIYLLLEPVHILHKISIFVDLHRVKKILLINLNLPYGQSSAELPVIQSLRSLGSFGSFGQH